MMTSKPPITPASHFPLPLPRKGAKIHEQKASEEQDNVIKPNAKDVVYLKTSLEQEGIVPTQPKPTNPWLVPVLAGVGGLTVVGGIFLAVNPEARTKVLNTLQFWKKAETKSTAVVDNKPEIKVPDPPSTPDDYFGALPLVKPTLTTCETIWHTLQDVVYRGKTTSIDGLLEHVSTADIDKIMQDCFNGVLNPQSFRPDGMTVAEAPNIAYLLFLKAKTNKKVFPKKDDEALAVTSQLNATMHHLTEKLRATPEAHPVALPVQLFNVGQVYWKQGNKTEATAAFKESHRILTKLDTLNELDAPQKTLLANLSNHLNNSVVFNRDTIQADSLLPLPQTELQKVMPYITHLLADPNGTITGTSASTVLDHLKTVAYILAGETNNNPTNWENQLNLAKVYSLQRMAHEHLATLATDAELVQLPINAEKAFTEAEKRLMAAVIEEYPNLTDDDLNPLIKLRQQRNKKFFAETKALIEAQFKTTVDSIIEALPEPAKKSAVNENKAVIPILELKKDPLTGRRTIDAIESTSGSSPPISHTPLPPCDKAFLAIEQKVRTLQATPVTVLTRETKIKQIQKLAQELAEYNKNPSAPADVALTARIEVVTQALKQQFNEISD
ncbi:MAG: hypothetical protein H2174_02095 [Vampirovibrio sp.]|nr:hypothetical protein [Vampirovibrio sp.]